MVPLSCRSNLAGRYLYSKCSPMQVWFPALSLTMNLNLNTVLSKERLLKKIQFSKWHNFSIFGISKLTTVHYWRKCWILNVHKSADLVCKINDICLQFYLLFIVCFHPIPPTPPFSTDPMPDILELHWNHQNHRKTIVSVVSPCMPADWDDMPLNTALSGYNLTVHNCYIYKSLDLHEYKS